jgi:hypothetical protein
MKSISGVSGVRIEGEGVRGGKADRTDDGEEKPYESFLYSYPDEPGASESE